MATARERPAEARNEGEERNANAGMRAAAQERVERTSLAKR